jgi:hypothetical protein
MTENKRTKNNIIHVWTSECWYVPTYHTGLVTIVHLYQSTHMYDVQDISYHQRTHMYDVQAIPLSYEPYVQYLKCFLGRSMGCTKRVPDHHQHTSKTKFWSQDCMHQKHSTTPGIENSVLGHKYMSIYPKDTITIIKKWSQNQFQIPISGRSTTFQTLCFEHNARAGMRNIPINLSRQHDEINQTPSQWTDKFFLVLSQWTTSNT